MTTSIDIMDFSVDQLIMLRETAQQEYFNHQKDVQASEFQMVFDGVNRALSCVREKDEEELEKLDDDDFDRYIGFENIEPRDDDMLTFFCDIIDLPERDSIYYGGMPLADFHKREFIKRIIEIESICWGPYLPIWLAY